jgi:hypothetical protein
MRQEHVATYVGRQVYLASAAAVGVVEAVLAKSLILVWVGDKLLDISRLSDFCLRLLQNAPLGIAVAGGARKEAFDVLLQVQAGRRCEAHTMTRSCGGTDISETIDDFLFGTLPSNDRFDEWEAYCILLLTDDDKLDEFRRLLVMRCRGEDGVGGRRP